MSLLRIRRVATVVVAAIGLGVAVLLNQDAMEMPVYGLPFSGSQQVQSTEGDALAMLDGLPVKGRAPKTGYARAQFGNGWSSVQGCDTRNRILARDLERVELNEKCQVASGILQDPYTGKEMNFRRGSDTSQLVQVDHVVALSNAWQTGAQQLDQAVRIAFANDPLNLLAVEGGVNQQKSDGDAATWLPPHRPFRCQYVARQIAIKAKYELWVVPPEKEAMRRILQECPGQGVPIASDSSGVL